MHAEKSDNANAESLKVNTFAPPFDSHINHCITDLRSQKEPTPLYGVTGVLKNNLLPWHEGIGENLSPSHLISSLLSFFHIFKWSST